MKISKSELRNQMVVEKHLEFSISFPQKGLGVYFVIFRFQDGTEEKKEIKMKHNDFIREWKQFNKWFLRIRQIRPQSIEEPLERQE